MRFCSPCENTAGVPVVEARARDLSSEDVDAFRDAALSEGERSIVQWLGRPHVVLSAHELTSGDVLFELTPH